MNGTDRQIDRRPGNGSGDGLRAQGVSVSYAGLVAVDDVDFALRDGEILGLIGPNGAGKTTLVNLLSGFAAPDRGRVFLEGASITGASPRACARRGLARTFQGGRLFDRLSVMQNLEAAALGCGRRPRDARRDSEELLGRLGILDLSEVAAANLAYGQVRRVALARALVTRPRFLLLDEPAAGLDDQETTELLRMLRQLRDDFECALLVIEHDMRLVMGLCERVHVLVEGRTLIVGSPSAVSADVAVQTAYLRSDVRPPS